MTGLSAIHELVAYKVLKDGLFGVIDSDLSVVLPIKFKDIDFNEPFNDPYMEREWYYKTGVGAIIVMGQEVILMKKLANLNHIR